MFIFSEAQDTHKYIHKSVHMIYVQDVSAYSYPGLGAHGHRSSLAREEDRVKDAAI